MSVNWCFLWKLIDLGISILLESIHFFMSRLVVRSLSVVSWLIHIPSKSLFPMTICLLVSKINLILNFKFKKFISRILILYRHVVKNSAFLLIFYPSWRKIFGSSMIAMFFNRLKRRSISRVEKISCCLVII